MSRRKGLKEREGERHQVGRVKPLHPIYQRGLRDVPTIAGRIDQPNQGIGLPGTKNEGDM
jgi:hypothetical protein